MADIHLGPGNDVYVQPLADKDNWHNIFGEDGNDTIRLYQGTAIGGKGNDHIERIVVQGEPWRIAGVAYWSAGDNLRVNLLEGWAEDGEGGRDTLVGISHVHGSGAKNAWVQGGPEDNYYWPNGGTDTFLGGPGYDGVSLNSSFEPMPGLPWRQPLLSDLDIRVSVDGLSATVLPKTGTGFRIDVADVEYFDIPVSADTTLPWVRYHFADFITQQTMAEQGIVAGETLRWNFGQSIGSTVTVTYSFVTNAPTSGVGAPGFRPFTPSERIAVQELLASTSSFTGISFSEVVEGGNAVGQMRFGVSRQATTKGVSWHPNQAGAGDQAGDIWMDVESMVDMTPGGEGYAALLHEVGHALGLRHPRNTDPGEAWAVQLREGDDRPSLSAMSQTPSADGLFRSDWGPLDVLALRALYGYKAKATGDNTYLLGTAQSSAKTSIVDDGGIDTLDASAMRTGVSLSLVAGQLSSVGVTAAGIAGIDNLALPTGTLIEHAIGSPFDDVLIGNAVNNRLTGGLGNDWIEGGEGVDTAVFAGPRAGYEVSNGFGKVFVRARDGVSGFDTLIGVETLQFDDQTIQLSPTALGSDGNYAVDEDASLNARLPDPSGVERSAVSYRLLAQGANGVASIDAAGNLSFTPKADFWGTDAVAFEIVGAAGVNRYLAHIDVLPINDAAPVGKNGEYLAQSGAYLYAQLPVATDRDGDSLSYALVVDGAQGKVTVNTNGSFVYKTEPSQIGSDTFRYSVSDGMGGTSEYTVTLTLAGLQHLRTGTSAADVMAAFSTSDGYTLLEGDDIATGGAGNDIIDGGPGRDKAIYAGVRNNFTLSQTSTHLSVVDKTGAEGNDRLVSIERLQFKDKSIAFDLDGNAGQVAKILGALFGKAYLTNATYAGIGIDLLDKGMSYPDLIALAIGTDVFTGLAGGNSNRQFVDFIYRNVVGTAPSAGESLHFTALLDQGVFTRTSLAQLAADTSLNAQSIDLVGLASAGLEYLPLAEG